MSECIFTITDSNGIPSTYDLNQFYFRDSVHEVDDKTYDKYSYKFNVCGSIPKPLFVKNTTIPDICTGDDHAPCIKFEDKNGSISCSKTYPSTSTLVPSAVQIISSADDHRCFWLGMELSDSYTTEFPNYNVSLIEPDDSAAGIVLKIMNGQYCEAAGIERNRELNIKFVCPDSTLQDTDAHKAQVITEDVTETETCIYELEFESPLACPSECITSSSGKFSVCSTHGVCVADPKAGKSRCICDDGFDGDYCESVYTSITTLHGDNDDLLTAIIIVVVCIALFCGIAVFLWFKWRSHMELHKMLNPANEYFLGIEDDIEEDDDTLQAGHNIKKTTDTFHPIVSVDAGTAKMIQQEHEKVRKQSIELEEEERRQDKDNNTNIKIEEIEDTDPETRDIDNAPEEPVAEEQEQEQEPEQEQDQATED